MANVAEAHNGDLPMNTIFRRSHAIRAAWPLMLTLAGCVTSPVNHLELAHDAERAGNFEVMVSHCRAAAQERDPDPWAFKCIGDGEMRAGNRQGAEVAYLSYLDKQPGDIAVRLKLVEIILAARGLDRPADAKPHVEKVLSADPNNAQAYYYLGEINRLSGLCVPSMKAYKRAIEIDPGYREAKNGLQKTKQEICKKRKPRKKLKRQAGPMAAPAGGQAPAAKEQAPAAEAPESNAPEKEGAEGQDGWIDLKSSDW
jgi:predicted Zn-dependent protease